MERDRNQRNDPQRAGTPEDAARKRRAAADPRLNEPIEASGTDGKGTGGVGEDAGGYGPVPGSDATG